MKQSFFYELSAGLQGRSRAFRLIVITSLILCALIFLEYAVHFAQSELFAKRNDAATLQKRNNQLAQPESITLRGK